MSDWTDAEIKAVLAESATEERRKAYGLTGTLRNWAAARPYSHEKYHQAQSEVLTIIAKVEKGGA